MNLSGPSLGNPRNQDFGLNRSPFVGYFGSLLCFGTRSFTSSLRSLDSKSVVECAANVVHARYHAYPSPGWYSRASWCASGLFKATHQATQCPQSKKHTITFMNVRHVPIVAFQPLMTWSSSTLGLSHNSTKSRFEPYHRLFNLGIHQWSVQNQQ